MRKYAIICTILYKDGSLFGTISANNLTSDEAIEWFENQRHAEHEKFYVGNFPTECYMQDRNPQGIVKHYNAVLC